MLLLLLNIQELYLYNNNIPLAVIILNNDKKVYAILNLHSRLIRKVAIVN